MWNTVAAAIDGISPLGERDDHDGQSAFDGTAETVALLPTRLFGAAGVHPDAIQRSGPSLFPMLREQFLEFSTPELFRCT